MRPLLRGLGLCWASQLLGCICLRQGKWFRIPGNAWQLSGARIQGPDHPEDCLSCQGLGSWATVDRWDNMIHSDNPSLLHPPCFISVTLIPTPSSKRLSSQQQSSQKAGKWKGASLSFLPLGNNNCPVHRILNPLCYSAFLKKLPK